MRGRPVHCLAAALLGMWLVGCAARLAAEGPGALLPERLGQALARGAVQEWPAEELWIDLNGAASLYQDAGTRRMGTRSYAGEGVEFTAKLFDVGESLLAFGLFSQLRDENSRPLDLGDGGALGTSDLIFWQGRYFASLLLRDPAARADARLEGAARALAAQLPAGSGPPPRLGLLPEEGRLAQSERYYRQNALGYEFLGDGVGAEYGAGEHRAQAYVFCYGQAEETRAALAGLAEGLEEGAALGEGVFAGTDPFAGETLLAARGAHLVLVQGNWERGDLQALLGRVLERIAAAEQEGERVRR